MNKRRTRAEIMAEQLAKLTDQREKNVNRYIIPIELKMSVLKERLKKYYKLPPNES